jgi:hypothetical protein
VSNGGVFLLFLAVSEVVDPATGYLDEVGVAILEFKECVDLRFGYPNDEGLPEHPLFEQGLSARASTVGEVLNSEWVRDTGAQMHANRQVRRANSGRACEVLVSSICPDRLGLTDNLAFMED